MLNDHDQYEELIPDYCSGRLTESESEGLRRHADACERCSRTLAELRPLFLHLDIDKLRHAPPGYFSTVLPNVRARIDAEKSLPAPKRIPEFVFPAAAIALAVMVILTLNLPWQESAQGPESISQAIGDIPADVLADALVDQADRAGVSDGSAMDVITDERFDREIVNTLTSDPSALGELEASSEALWPTDLSETEVTVLLQRLSEREVL